MKALFLDRDGVINVDVGYGYRIDQMQFLPGIFEFTKQYADAGYVIVVVTNQAGIARGYFDEAQLVEIHRTLDQLLDLSQAHIDAYYFCPHHPSAGFGEYKTDCSCRKPKPGLLIAAATHFNLDLAKCILVGDKATDIQAGQAAGCQTVLVQTGYGLTQLLHARPDRVCADLLDAVEGMKGMSG